jgi:hypothetical protein
MINENIFRLFRDDLNYQLKCTGKIPVTFKMTPKSFKYWFNDTLEKVNGELEVRNLPLIEII